MALQLKVSNSLVHLCNNLCEQLKHAQIGVFNPHRIITQTDGMNIWLKQQIAQNLGIAANIDFLKPNDIIFQLYRILGGKRESQLSRENLVWLLYHLLGTDTFQKKFKEHAAYLNEVISERNNKRLGLAEKIADLFDQYQIYRQEIIQEWNNADLNDTNLSWQEWLWVNAKNIATKSLPDKTVISTFILNEINNSEHHEKIKKQLPHIFLFGLSIITKYHIEIFYELSKITDISIYILNPAPDIYWEDDKTEKDLALWRSKGMKNTELQLVGNPLLSGWGKVLQNTFRLLFRNDIALNNYETITSELPQENTLLQKIQSDIFHNRTSDRLPITLNDLQDESITIHNNYTIAREIQSLYHYLVHLIDKKKAKLSPRDMVVMVTDIDKYAPFIKAVFDNAPYTFKYNIADVSQSSGDTLHHALQQLLNLNEENFTSENVLQLLEFTHIRKKFDLYDIEKIRSLITAANIRFGIDGNKEDDTNLVSWIYGIKRIMFGICMSEENLTEYKKDAFYPIDIIEGVDSFEAVKFVYFVEQLIDSIEKRKQNKNINQWIDYVEEITNNLLHLTEDNIDDEYNLLLDTLSGIKQNEDIIQEYLDYPIFCKYLSNKLALESRSSIFISNGITFCSLIPMRSIPFKVIALLGMNHDTFPRKETNLSFNLITQKHQLGDRNIKDNDKHLFLETILSAKDFVFISYLGKSVADNKPLPASILVEELLDYIQTGITDETLNATDVIITQHPLHANSRKYNNDDHKLYYYNNDVEHKTELVLQQSAQPEINIPENIHWKEIIAFIKNGPKTYYTKMFGIYYNTDTYILPETEDFTFDNLDSYLLKQQIIKIDDHNQLTELQQRLLLTGRLPLKNVGVSVFEDETEAIQTVLTNKNKLTEHQNEEVISINLNLEQVNVQATIDNIYQRQYIFPCFSKNIKKYMMEAYLHFLILRATDNADEIYFLHSEDIYTYSQKISATEAKKEIEKLISLYINAIEAPYPICAELFDKPKKTDEIIGNYLIPILESKINNYMYPLTDKYILQAYKEGVFHSEDAIAKYETIYDIALAPLEGFVLVE